MILVIGTGRSGTSAVAKLLHEHGVSMGTCFVSSAEHESGSTFEDTEIKKINMDFLKNKRTYDDYLNRLCRYGRMKKGQWGVKHPMITHVLGIYLQVFDPIIIRCTRDREGVVKSCMRCYGFTQKQSENLYDYRTAILDSVLGRVEHLEIDFTERLDEDYIWKKVARFLKRVKPDLNLGEPEKAQVACQA